VEGGNENTSAGTTKKRARPEKRGASTITSEPSEFEHLVVKRYKLKKKRTTEKDQNFEGKLRSGEPKGRARPLRILHRTEETELIEGEGQRKARKRVDCGPQVGGGF